MATFNFVYTLAFTTKIHKMCHSLALWIIPIHFCSWLKVDHHHVVFSSHDHNTFLLYPQKRSERGILELPWMSVHLSVDTILSGAFSYSFAHTALKFIHVFITLLSLVAELSPLDLVNFTKSLLSRELLVHFCKYCSKIYTMFVCI